nr:hypothetical protein [Tanacetum cinerariifolium]
DSVSEIKSAFGNQQYKPEDIQELFRKLFNNVHNIHEGLARYINTSSWNRPSFYNNKEDDDEDYTIAITPDFSITDSLSMGDEHLSTIPETESDELIKSSVENLVPNPSEFEDLSNIGKIDETDFDPEEEIRLVEKFLYDNSSPRPAEEPNSKISDDRVSEINSAFGNQQYKPEDIQELFRKLFNNVHNIHEGLARYINTSSWNRPSFYNNKEDDDEDYTIAITPDFSITDSLSMGDEHLSTIPETESDELIKSS